MQAVAEHGNTFLVQVALLARYECELVEMLVLTFLCDEEIPHASALLA